MQRLKALLQRLEDEATWILLLASFAIYGVLLYDYLLRPVLEHLLALL